MLDPGWTPAKGYSHAERLLAMVSSPQSTTKEEEVPPKKKTTTKPTGKSVKIPPAAYAKAQRIARRDRRTITTTIELAIDRLAAEGSSS
jgi:hypothetical protein